LLSHTEGRIEIVVFEKGVLREEVSGDWRRLRNLYVSPDGTRVVKSRKT
jgi:hypothetical protein